MLKKLTKSLDIYPNQTILRNSIKPSTRLCIFLIFRKLRVGYCISDGYYEPHPGCKRAVLETTRLVEKLGHSIIKVINKLEYPMFFSIDLKISKLPRI